MTLQYSLLDPVPLARRLDPAPSHEAARKAQAFAGTHEEKIVAYLVSIFPKSAHAEQIANATGLTIVQVDRRRAGGLAANRIIITGTGTMCNGNSAGMWRRT
jgi:hypothetical protein